MVKEVYFVRHGQSEFNAWRAKQFFSPTQWLVKDPMIRDAVLTRKGQEQAVKQRLEAAGIGPVELLVSSPLTRAVQTMRLMFPEATCPVLLTPLCREKLNYACDIGLPTSKLKAMYPDYTFAHFEGEHWWKHRPNAPFEVCKETVDEVKQRIAAFRDFLQTRKETKIVVVAHGYFIQMTLEDWLMPGNCQIRRVDLR